MKERPMLFSGDERWIKAAASRIKVSSRDYADALNAGMKICGGCQKSLPRTADHFGRDAKTFDGFRSKCRPCISDVKRSHYHRTRPEQRKRQLKYQQENRETLYAYNNAWQRKRRAQIRGEMLSAYGARCNCCGESEPIFLDLDHIENDGASHRKELGNGLQVLLALKAVGWPSDRYQLLCCNCNQGKARNGGICPHQTKEARHA